MTALKWYCPGCEAPTASYLICTSPRTGSWLLSDVLTTTGLAGNPREWLNPLEEQELRARIEDGAKMSYQEYLNQACAQSHTSNGISGIKTHYYQLDLLAERTGAHEDDLMRGLFPKGRYIHLIRRNKTRQAISYLIAQATGEWHFVSGEPVPRTAEPEFNPEAIYEAIQVFRRQDKNWVGFFTRNGITPLVLCYEADLMRNYQHTARRVLDWLEVPGADTAVIPQTRFRRQSGERSEDWLRRYAEWWSRRVNH